jgi:hypothetical protein
MDPSLYPRGLQFNLPPTPAAPQSGGMFGGGGKFGIGQAIVAALNGYLASQPGGAGEVGRNNIQMMQQGFANKRQQAQAMAQHQQEMQDQIALHQANRDYDVSHAPPPDIQDRIDVLNKIDPTLGATYARNYAQNGGGLGPMITNPVTGQQMMPAGRAPAQAPPDEAVARLRSNPAEAQQFDEIFGPGSAARALGAGGPAGSPSPGGFSY